MKTILLRAAAVIALTTIAPGIGLAQQNGEDGYRPSQNDGYGANDRGGYGRQSQGRQNNPYLDRDTNAMMGGRRGARFRFRRGDSLIDIRCPQNEPLQDCVEAASRLMEKVRSLTPNTGNKPSAAPAPGNAPAPGATPSPHSD
jgi:hypothetical protein